MSADRHRRSLFSPSHRFLLCWEDNTSVLGQFCEWIDCAGGNRTRNQGPPSERITAS